MPNNTNLTMPITGLWNFSPILKYLSKPTIEDILSLKNKEITKRHVFSPYDKILVRINENSVWLPSLFAGYVNYDGEITVMATDHKLYSHCVSYDDYPYLVFDTDEPEEFYRERLMKNGPILQKKIEEAINEIGKDE